MPGGSPDTGTTQQSPRPSSPGEPPPILHPGRPRSLFARYVTDRPLPCPGPHAPVALPSVGDRGRGRFLRPGTCSAQGSPRLRGVWQTERPARGLPLEARRVTPGRGAGTNIKRPTLENAGHGLATRADLQSGYSSPPGRGSLHGEKPRRVAPPQCSPSRAGGTAPPRSSTFSRAEQTNRCYAAPRSRPGALSGSGAGCPASVTPSPRAGQPSPRLAQ
jgi:hypothetical protein